VKVEPAVEGNQQNMKNFVPLIGRILIASIFLSAGIEKIMNPGQTQQYMASHGMPLVGFLMVCAIAVELGGGLSVLFGFKARLGAAVLALFLVPTTLIFHTKFPDQQINFMKNLAIIGGLLLIFYFGPGPISLDERAKGKPAGLP
jgi:putative oxidoreductase